MCLLHVATLHVQYTQCCDYISYSADVESIPDQTVPTGNSAIFICVAVGAPSNVAYSWSHEVDGVPVPIQNPDNVGRVMGIDSSMLTITNVGVQDEDMIRCTVSVGGVDLAYTTATLSVISESSTSIMICVGIGKLHWKFSV